MKSEKNLIQKISEVTDLLKQIQSINEMIELHQKESDSFILNQYRFSREKFLKALTLILGEFKITPEDLAA